MIEHLLAMESEAHEAMADIAKETAELTARAEESLRGRVAAVEADSAKEIRQLVRECEEHTAAEIARVQDEYRLKTAAYKAEARNLRGKIFHDVLYGSV